MSGAGDELIELACELADGGGFGILSTLICQTEVERTGLVGMPYGSLVPTAADDRGAPLFLLSALAVHTRNINADPRASLLLRDYEAADPLAAPRATFLGRIETVDDEQQVRQRFTSVHPSARDWLSFGDFTFMRLAPLRIYLVGGFGRMGFIEPDDFATAFTDRMRS